MFPSQYVIVKAAVCSQLLTVVMQEQEIVPMDLSQNKNERNAYTTEIM